MPCSTERTAQSRDALNLARLRPISQLGEAKSATGRNNSLVMGVCRPKAAQSTSLMRHTQERPMLRVTSSIGPSPLIAADNRRSNSGVGLLLAPRGHETASAILSLSGQKQTSKAALRRASDRQRFRDVITIYIPGTPATARAALPHLRHHDRRPRRRASDRRRVC